MGCAENFFTSMKNKGLSGAWAVWMLIKTIHLGFPRGSVGTRGWGGERIG